MASEPQEILRRFCDSSECPIWKAIKKAQSVEDSELESVLRLHCADACKAYQFNRFLHVSNLKISTKTPNERY